MSPNIENNKEKSFFFVQELFNIENQPDTQPVHLNRDQIKRAKAIKLFG